MTEDEILSRLGQHVRDEQKDDEAFARVARAEADAAQLGELERSAAADPEFAVRLEASRPLEEGAADRIALSLTKSRAARTAPKSAAVAVRPSTSKVVWWRRGAVLAGPLALAAAMLLYVATQRGSSGPELPLYEVSATGERAMRGPAAPSTRLRLGKGRDARFELVLRPATAPLAKVVAYAFANSASGSEPAPLDAKVEIAAEGAVRLSGPARALDGASEIRVVVGTPGAIGKFDDAAALAKRGTSDTQVRVLTIAIDRE